MARTDTLGHFLTDVADAIREKTGSSEAIPASDFDTEIENIPSGGGSTSNIIYTTVTGSTGHVTAWYNTLFALEGIKNLTFILDPTAQENRTNFRYIFSGCYWRYLPKFISNGELVDADLSYSFINCSYVTELDLSGVIGNTKRITSCFSGCIKLTKLDIRGLVLSTTSSSYTSSAFDSVPDDCLIIVKNDTEKTWVTTKFSKLTNVKTVAEYESNEI